MDADRLGDRIRRYRDLRSQGWPPGLELYCFTCYVHLCVFSVNSSSTAKNSLSLWGYSFGNGLSKPLQRLPVGCLS